MDLPRAVVCLRAPRSVSRGILRDQILGGPDGLFEVVSTPNVEARLSALPARHSTFVPNVHTASVLLSSVWVSTPPETAPVTLPLPDGVKGTR